MKSLLPIVCSLLMVGCFPSTTSVRISDPDGEPVSGFPLRFELDDGLEQTNRLGGRGTLFTNPNGVLLEGELTKLDERAFGTRTNSQGLASISYHFKKRQPASWRIRIFGGSELPDQRVDVIPLETLPKGSRISVATPNP